MPFVKVKIEEVIEQKCQQSETFKQSWDESREEYQEMRCRGENASAPYLYILS